MGHELTKKEQEVLGLMATGLSNQGIAEKLGIQPKSVDTHCTVIHSKLMVDEDAARDKRVSAVLAWQKEHEVLSDLELCQLYREFSEWVWRSSFEKPTEGIVLSFREWLPEALVRRNADFAPYELEMLAEYRRQEGL